MLVFVDTYFENILCMFGRAYLKQRKTCHVGLMQDVFVDPNSTYLKKNKYWQPFVHVHVSFLEKIRVNSRLSDILKHAPLRYPNQPPIHPSQANPKTSTVFLVESQMKKA